MWNTLNLSSSNERKNFEKSSKCFFLHNFKYEDPYVKYYWVNNIRVAYKNTYVYCYVNGVFAKKLKYEVVQEPQNSFTDLDNFFVEHHVFMRFELSWQKKYEAVTLKATFPNGCGLPDELVEYMHEMDDEEGESPDRVKLNHREYERYLNAFLASLGFEYNMFTMFQMCYDEMVTQALHQAQPSYFENCAKNSMLLSAVGIKLDIQGYRIFTKVVNEMDKYGPRTEVVLRNPQILCVICDQVITVGEELRSLLCGHEFHRRCIELQIFYARTCPICSFRMPINLRNIVQALNIDVEKRTNIVKTNVDIARIRLNIPTSTPPAHHFFGTVTFFHF